MTSNSPSPRRLNVRRLAIGGSVGLVLIYLLFVSAGYLWLRHALHNERIGLVDVALCRWKEVRRTMAAEQFAAGKKAWEAKDYQAAYLALTSGVRNDPLNAAGRLLTANFLGAAGAVNLEVTLLEEGLSHTPDDPQLLEQTLALLTATGRDARALELLRKQYATKLTGTNGLLLRRSELLATLNAEGATAARQLLEKYSDLKRHHPATPVVAQVLWESQDRLAAIDLLSGFLQSQPGAYSVYAQQADWQASMGMKIEARKTAERACAQFPSELAPRILLIATASPNEFEISQRSQQEIATYLKDFADRPEAIPLLASLAGRNGWVNLAHTLYAVGADRQPNLAMLALSYSDALARTAHLNEARQILAQIELQAPDGNSSFMSTLRQRQIVVAAALNDHDGTREFARRLAAALRNDPDGLEVCRRRFIQLKIPDAAAELASTTSAAKSPARK